MREKYIDERTGVWFIFGEYDDGFVDISDGDTDVWVHIEKNKAERLCAIQAEFRERLYAELRDHVAVVYPGPKPGGLPQ